MDNLPQIEVIAFTDLGVRTSEEFNKLTIKEYILRSKAFKSRLEEKRLFIHLQAWLNRQIEARDESGAWVYSRWSDFYEPLDSTKPKKKSEADLFMEALKRQKKAGG